MSHDPRLVQQIAGQRQATDPARFVGQGLSRFVAPSIERNVERTEQANLVRAQQLIPLSTAQKEVFRPLIFRGLVLTNEQRKGQGLTPKTGEQIEQGVESILSRATQGDAAVWDKAFARLQGQQRNILGERELDIRAQPKEVEPEDTFKLLNEAENQVIKRRKSRNKAAGSDVIIRAEAIIDVMEKLGPQRAARTFGAYSVINFMLGQLSPAKAAEQVEEWVTSREDISFLNNFGGPRVETYLQGLREMSKDDRTLWQRTLGFLTTTSAKGLNIPITTPGTPGDEGRRPTLADRGLVSTAGIVTRDAGGRSPSVREDLGRR